MYETHFGFHRQPFQASDVGNAFFLADSVQKLLPQLLHALRTDLGIAVLTGPAGSGKTALLRHLRHLLSRDGRAVVCSAAGLESPAELLEALDNTARMRAGSSFVSDAATHQPDVTVSAGRISRWTVTERLRRSTELWGPALLLIDDAQLLSVAVLNELRAFTEDLSSGTQLVRCLIAGPLSLEEELARPTHSDFSRRIRCHVFLQPFTQRESIAYLNQQLELVGASAGSVLTAAAIDLIVTASDGSPRCINLLADESLVIACERRQSVVDGQCVSAALNRLQHLPYAWNIVVNADGMPADVPDCTDVDVVDDESAETAQTAGQTGKALEKYSTHKVDSSERPAAPAKFEFNAPGVIEIGSASPFDHRSSQPERLPVNVTQTQFDPAIDDSSQRESTDTLELPELPELDEAIPAAAEDVVLDDSAGFDCDRFNCDDFDADGVDSDSQGFWLADEEEPPAAVVKPRAMIQLPESAGQAFSDQTPIFDRYTWIALGRDVPDGLAATDAIWPHGVVAEEPEFAGPYAVPGLANTIPVFASTDREIRMMLSEAISAATEGFMTLNPLPPAVIENLATGIRPDFDSDIPDQIPAVIEQKHWRDGQLLESDPDAIVDQESETDASVNMESHETVSIRMRPDSDTEGHAQSPQSEAPENESDSEGISFYTLPIPVDRVDADQRFRFHESDDEYPLAASMARLQSEVDDFHRISSGMAQSADRTDVADDLPNLPRRSDPLPGFPGDGLAAATNDDGTWRSGSLLQQALERLSASPVNAGPVSANPPNANPWSSQSSDTFVRQNSHQPPRLDLSDADSFETSPERQHPTDPAEFPNQDSEQTHAPRFSQLFTRLRGVQNRSDL